MATKFNSTNKYLGSADLADPRLAGLGVNEMVNQYTDRVEKAGGSVLDENHLRETITALRDSGVLSACRFFDMIDARWGVSSENGLVKEAFGLSGFSMTPTKTSRSGSFDQSAWPGVGYETEDEVPHFITRENDGNFAGLLTNAVQLPNGDYVITFKTNRNLSEYAGGQVAFGPRISVDNPNIITDIIGKKIIHASKSNIGYWFRPDASYTGVTGNGEESNTGNLLTYTGITSFTEQSFYVVNPSSSFGFFGTQDQNLRNPQNTKMAIGANVQGGPFSVTNPSKIRPSYPCGFVNFGIAVTSDWRVASEIQRIASS